MPVASMATDKTKASARKAQGVVLHAWHGIGAEAPETWSIVQISGDRRQGYYRLDGPEGQSAEFRWQSVKRQPDLDKTAEQYLKQIQKASRKHKLDYRGVVSRSGRGEGRPVGVSFEWKADREGAGRLMWCPECRRTVICQVSWPRGVQDSAVSSRVLDSLRDHSDRGFEDWGVYGLSFRVPDTVKLSRQRLMSGFLSLNFAGKAGRVIVERWGLAEILTQDGFLKWHDREYLSELRGFRGESWGAELGEHEAVETAGYEAGVRRLKALVKAFLLPSRAETFGSVVWHCESSNRIIGVRAFGRRPLELARQVAQSVRCHSR